MSRIYRFFTKSANLRLDEANLPSKLVIDQKAEPELLFQLFKVLRVKPGDRIILLNRYFADENSYNLALKIPEFIYEVENCTKYELTLNFLSIQHNFNENTIGLRLALCLPNKPAKLDFIIEKAVEMGAMNITLIKSDFSYFNHQIKTERLEKIILEASEQSERGLIPALQSPVSLKSFLEHPPINLLVAMERVEEGQGAFSDFLTLLDQQIKIIQSSVKNGATDANLSSITLLIGPEGGFSPTEKKLIEELHLSVFSLGPRILRMETAAILALGIINAKIDSLRYL